MSRRCLENRRRAYVFPVEHREFFYDVQAGFFELGAEIGEVFISARKQSSDAEIAGNDIAVLISLLLQHGVPLPQISRTLTRGEAGEAQGLAGVVCDALMAEVET